MEINWKSKFYLYEMINTFLTDNNIKYRCDVFELCHDLGFNLIPYNCENYNECFDISKDGFSTYSKSDNEFYIFYNPRMPSKRINFTLAHEIGHIILNHHFLVKQNVLLYGSNNLWERQANIFAQNLLMPAIVTKKLQYKYNTQTYSEVFDVSTSMVETRLNKLTEDLLWLRKIK